MPETTVGSPEVTIILPAYNEGDTIVGTVRRLRKLYQDYEILVVDDASTDETAELAKREGARVVRNQVNKGYGGSLKCGLRHAFGDIVVFMDADGQHEARDVARLVKALEDCDMAVGMRSRDNQVAVRRPGKWLLTTVARVLIEQDIPDINSGFRALYRKDGLRFLSILPNGFSLTTTITLAMMKDSYEVRYLPIQVSPRGGGESQVAYARDGIRSLLLVLRVIMLFNPLKIFGPVSLVLLFLGVAYGITTLVLDGNLSDMSVLMILAGLGTLFMGLLADQLSNLRRGG